MKLEVAVKVEQRGNRWLLTSELRNPGASPALMVVVKAVRETTRERIVPAIYSDNYVALMPGEKRVIVTEVEDADTGGVRPAIAIEGFNVVPVR